MRPKIIIGSQRRIFLKRIKNIVSTFLIIILSLLLVSIVFLRFFVHAHFKSVITPSMEPDIPVGSLIVIFPAEYDDIAVGDDITFVRDEKLTLVTHRVISKDDGMITTKGITNNIPDAPTSYQNVLGKVILVLPLIGYPLMGLNTEKGKIIGIFIVLIIVALMITSDVLERRKKRIMSDQNREIYVNDSDQESSESITENEDDDHTEDQ